MSDDLRRRLLVRVFALAFAAFVTFAVTAVSGALDSRRARRRDEVVAAAVERIRRGDLAGARSVLDEALADEEAGRPRSTPAHRLVVKH